MSLSSPAPAEGRERLPRFSRGERWAHRALAVLVGVCLVTATVLYVDALAVAIGRRELVGLIHFISGVLIPVPLVAAFVLSPAFRADVHRLNRFLPSDWTWLRRSDRRSAGLPVGKFNAGQKLNAAFTAGAVVLLLITGLMLRYFGVFSDDARTGATFVHDVTALAVLLVALGHMWMAMADPEARVGMRTGRVDAEWADREHPAWAAEVRQSSDRQPPLP